MYLRVLFVAALHNNRILRNMPAALWRLICLYRKYVLALTGKKLFYTDGSTYNFLASNGAAMHKLKIRTRVFISIVFLLLGLAFLLHTYFATYRSEISMLDKERDGVAFLRVATEANEAFTAYRMLLYHAPFAEADYAARVQAAKQEVDDAFLRLQEAYAHYGEGLGLSEAYLAQRGRSQILFGDFAEQWKAIAAMPPAEVDEEKIAEIYITFIALSDHVTVTSMMVNDADIPSYSLMDASANHITHAMNRMFGFPGKGYAALKRGEEMALENKLWSWDISTYITGYNMVKVGGDVENAFFHDKPSQAEAAYLEKTRAAYEGYMATGSAMSETFSRAARGLEVDMAVFDQHMIAYRTAMYDLWYKIADQLDVRLDMRLQAKRDALYQALLVALLCSAFALGFFVFIMRDITRSFKRLEATTDRIAQGELDAEVPYQEYDDEIGHMARSIERLRKSYWWLRDE